jgi:heat shock protein HtpX
MTQFINNLKTTVLLALIIALFAWVGAFFGGTRGLILGFMFGGMANLVAYFFSDKIALMSTGAQPVSESEAPKLYAIVRDLSEKAGLPMPRIYVTPQQAPNAFATGRNPSHSVVAVTQGILHLCNEQELTGVLAHEISHVKHRDMLISTVAATIAGAISSLAYFAQWGLIFGGMGGGRDGDRRGGNLLGLLLMIIVAPIAAMLIQLAISRSREYNADAAGGHLCGNPLWLAGALGKLEGYNRRIPMDVSPAQSHLFIVQPLIPGALAGLFSTHPPIQKRIALLQHEAENMGLTERRFGD